MTPQTQQQLLSEIEKRKALVTENTDNRYSAQLFRRDYKIEELDFCIQLIKSITTNRSSQEPKIK